MDPASNMLQFTLLFQRCDFGPPSCDPALAYYMKQAAKWLASKPAFKMQFRSGRDRITSNKHIYIHRLTLPLLPGIGVLKESTTTEMRQLSVKRVNKQQIIQSSLATVKKDATKPEVVFSSFLSFLVWGYLFERLP